MGKIDEEKAGEAVGIACVGGCVTGLVAMVFVFGLLAFLYSNLTRVIGGSIVAGVAMTLLSGTMIGLLGYISGARGRQ